MDEKVKKDLVIIIGSNRCGTTSLYNYLKQHPEVEASRVKMTGYFLDKNYPKATFTINDYYEDGNDFFKAYFNAQNAPVFLEASPDYMYSKGTLNRLVEFKKFNNINLKLIALVRDPRQRFYSMFFHLKKLDLLKEGIGLKEFFDLQTYNYDDDLVKSTMAMGFYHRFLKKYEATFSNDELIVCSFEEMTQEPKKILIELCNWIGISPNIYDDNFKFEKYNQGIKKTKTKSQKTYLRWRKKVFSFVLERPLLFKFISPIAQVISKQLFKPKKNESKDNWERSEIYHLLSKQYKDEAMQLSKLFPSLKLTWDE